MTNSDLIITVAHFEELTFAGQAAIIWQRGLPVATREVPPFRLHLYSVGGFFVEIWVCRRRFAVTMIRALSDTDELMPYIDMYSLSDGLGQ